MKLCKDCKWFEPYKTLFTVAKNGRCQRIIEREPDYVQGGEIITRCSSAAEYERRYEDGKRCGPDAKFWEPRS